MSFSRPVFERVVNLSKEVAVFLQESSHKATEKFEDENFLLMLCYLADIFGLVSQLNLSLQGSNTNGIVYFQKVYFFINMLLTSKKRVLKGNMANFKLIQNSKYRATFDKIGNEILALPWGETKLRLLDRTTIFCGSVRR